jgi:2-polyprenyl-6-methoxyphenol hydroxylase-like FAD-dependent oxidoreductase
VLGGRVRPGGDPAAALRDYESERILRTAPIQEKARRRAAMGAVRNPVACAIRNRVLQVLLKRSLLTEHRELVAHDLQA